MRSRVLGERDRELVESILAADPVTHCFVASRVEAGALSPSGPGAIWGYPADRPRSLLHLGANLVPVDVDAEAVSAFAEDLGRWRTFIAIVGPADQALGLWRALCQRWGQAYRSARVVRERQLLMATDRPSPVAADPRLERARPAYFDSYFQAAADMYTEELEEDPRMTNPMGYRSHVQTLIEQGRAFAIAESGRVLFKADLGAVSRRTAQVQGVWVRPELRGRGLSVPGMAGVTDAIVADGRIASLYVNDFNAPAIACYRRVGYTVRGALASVLY